MSELLSWRERAQIVVLVDAQPRRPVYHARGVWEFNDKLQRTVEWTRCGRSIGAYDAWLPRRLAAMFARPCRQCYGDLPEQLELA